MLLRSFFFIGLMVMLERLGSAVGILWRSNSRAMPQGLVERSSARDGTPQRLRCHVGHSRRKWVKILQLMSAGAAKKIPFYPA